MGYDTALAFDLPPETSNHLRVAYTRPASTTALRAAIVDDSSAGRERLRRLLEAAPDVEVVGAGTTGDDAIALAGSLMPDLMFVAIRKPRLDAMAAVAAVPEGRRPILVVIAEDEEHAFHAFEFHAVDYLLAPFTDERFQRSLAHARRLTGVARPGPQAALQRPGLPARRLIVKSPGQLTFIPLADIDWVESAGNYVRVHAGRETHVTRESMKGVEARLDERFVRVHRGAIVNSDRIRRIANDDSGHPWVVLKDGTQVSAGRYLEEKLGEWVSGAC